MTNAHIKSKLQAIAIALLILPGTALAWTGDTWGNITRATIKSNADLMIDATWVPKNSFTDWEQDTTYYSYTGGTTYTGVAYTQNDPQQNLPEFLNSVTNTAGGSVKYGSDCSGFVSMCWRLPLRENTTKFESQIGTYWVSLGNIGSAASVSLLPGDALNYAGVHIFMFLDYESGGIRTMEQTKNHAQHLLRSFSSLGNYRPIRRLQILEDKVISLGGNMAFGGVLVGTNTQRTLTINNSGVSNLTVSSISYPAGFSGNWSGTIAPGGSQNVTVTFSPSSVTSYGGSLTINSDATIGTNTLAISGYGSSSTSTSRMLILAPGETATFGVAPGKSGSPGAQYSTVGFPVTVYVVDANYNLISNDMDMAGLSLSTGSGSLQTNTALVGGTQTFMVTNTSVGSATIVATNVSQGTAVATGTTTVTVGVNSTTTTLVSSMNPAKEGQAVSFAATLGGAGVKTGTITVYSGATVLGTAAVSGNQATVTISGGAGTYPITAYYSGDANNSGSVSGTLSQVIQSGGTVSNAPAQLMQEGFDYAVQLMPTAAVGAWSIIPQSSTVVGIIGSDLAGNATPTLKPLPNLANPASHLVLGGSPTTDRAFYRSFSNTVTAGSVYLSYLLNNGFGVVNPDEVVCIMTSASGTLHTNGSLGQFVKIGNSLYYPDPLTLHARTNSGLANSYQLGVERLGGTTVWATNALTSGAGGVTYLVVLKYNFGGGGTCSLFINPTPGGVEPVPSAITAATGTESNDVGRVVFYEGDNPATSGIARATNALDGYNYDVVRADTSWYNVTPSTATPGPGATKLVFSPAAQSINENANSALITVTLKDQSNNVFTATADTPVSLDSDSDSGLFLSGTDGTTAIASVTIVSNTSTASFYYNDGLAGTPTITAASGLLTPAVQTETVNKIPGDGQLPHITSVSGTGPVHASMMFYGVAGTQYHVQRSTDLRTWTSPGDLVTADGNGNVIYTDNAGPSGAAYYKLVYP